MKKSSIGRDKYFNKVRIKAGKAINTFELIKADDRIAVGVSGGKDSLTLLEVLNKRKEFIPIDYKLFAVHVNIVNIPYEIDRQFLKDFCEALEIPLYIEEIQIDLNKKTNKSPCFTCSWNRRKVLFTKTAKLKCNKLALGHHMDDIIETLFMNMTFQGSISTMPPKLSMFNNEFEIIRPFSLIPEKDIYFYAKQMGFPLEKKNCPYSKETSRNKMKQIVTDLVKINKKARNNIFWSMTNIKENYLPQLVKPEPKKN